VRNKTPEGLQNSSPAILNPAYMGAQVVGKWQWGGMIKGDDERTRLSKTIKQS